jgi:hypothetical protein
MKNLIIAGLGLGLGLALNLQADMDISVPYKNTFMVYSSNILTQTPVKSIIVYAYVEKTKAKQTEKNKKEEDSSPHVEGDYSGGMEEETATRHVVGDYSGGMEEEENEKKVENVIGKSERTRENVKYVLSQKNIVQNVCTGNYCVIVDNMLNKYVFDQKNIDSYKFVTNN